MEDAVILRWGAGAHSPSPNISVFCNTAGLLRVCGETCWKVSRQMGDSLMEHACSSSDPRCFKRCMRVTIV